MVDSQKLLGLNVFLSTLFAILSLLVLGSHQPPDAVALLLRFLVLFSIMNPSDCDKYKMPFIHTRIKQNNIEK